MIHDALAELLDHRTLVAVAESSLGLERARRLSRSTSLLSSHIIADHMWFFCYYLLLTFNCPELIHCRESLCPISWALPPPSCSIIHCLVIKPGSQENPRYSLIVSWLKHPATHPMASSGISQHSHVDFRRVYLFYLHYTPVISH